MSKFFQVVNVVSTLNQLSEQGVDNVVFVLKPDVDSIAASRSLTAALTRTKLPSSYKVSVRKTQMVVESKVVLGILVSVVGGKYEQS